MLKLRIEIEGKKYGALYDSVSYLDAESLASHLAKATHDTILNHYYSGAVVSPHALGYEIEED